MTDLRTVLLEAINASEAVGDQRLFGRKDLLERAARALEPRGAGFLPNPLAWDLLDAWDDLFRSGLISYGWNIANLGRPGDEGVHLTARGRSVLQNRSRDPNNPAGYLETLRQHLDENSVAWSYAREAVKTYNAGCERAAAVLIGASSESLVLTLRDELAPRIVGNAKAIARLNDRSIKRVLEALEEELPKLQPPMSRPLEERFSAFWSAFTHQLRMVRNDAGHPASIDPVTPESVHAALLVFPEIARLIGELRAFVMVAPSVGP